MNKLEIKDLHVSIGGKEILKGLTLTVKQGEIHALMGPNGSGKSTLSNVIMGHPKYTVTKGDILFNDQSIISLKPNERAKLGLFLSFQYPMEVAGVQMANFLRLARNSVHGDAAGNKAEQLTAFRKELKEKMTLLKMKESFSTRYLNDGFSGGEKKRSEILQMAMLRPKIAILDETDSGLDIDALRAVAEGINEIRKTNPMGILLITHYQRMLKFVDPDFVHIVVDGRIVKSGKHELVTKLEEEGYSWASGEENGPEITA